MIRHRRETRHDGFKAGCGSNEGRKALVTRRQVEKIGY